MKRGLLTSALVALLIGFAAGCGNSETNGLNAYGPWTVEQVRAFPDYTVLWLGEEYHGLPVTKVTREVANDNPKLPYPTSKDGFEFQYGTCTIPKGADSCPIPVSIQVRPRCYLPPEVLPRSFQKASVETIRGGAELLGIGGHVVIWTGEIAVTVIAPNPNQAALALRPINETGDAESALPAPNKAQCSKIMGRDRSDVLAIRCQFDESLGPTGPAC